MSVNKNMVALWRLLENIADGLEEYLVAAGQGNGAGAQEIRRRCLTALDSCFDLLDRSVEQCHGLAGERRAEAEASRVTGIDRGLH